ncbi:MAG: hypothetical protein V2B20_13780 [Pseudomonadota bacterium]
MMEISRKMTKFFISASIFAILSAVSVEASEACDKPKLDEKLALLMNMYKNSESKTYEEDLQAGISEAEAICPGATEIEGFRKFLAGRKIINKHIVAINTADLSVAEGERILAEIERIDPNYPNLEKFKAKVRDKIVSNVARRAEIEASQPKAGTVISRTVTRTETVVPGTGTSGNSSSESSCNTEECLKEAIKLLKEAPPSTDPPKVFQ